MENQNDVKHWKSIRDFLGDPAVDEIKAHEFISGVTEQFNVDEMTPVSRRKFLALLGASTAFAAAGCSDYPDKGHIVPYNKKPEEIIPGVANYYASTCDLCPQRCGILIKAREGRPIKVDGNPDHPINQGKICAKGHAHILDLYDPNRAHFPMKRNGGSFTQTTWDDVDRDVMNRLSTAVASGKEIAVITHTIASPTTKAVLEDFTARFPTTRVHSYETFSDANRIDAWKRCFGDSPLPVIDWKKAKVIVALEADLFSTEGFVLEQIRDFAAQRDITKSTEFNRLYVVESSMSLTGQNADHRIRLRPEAQLELALALLHEIGKRGASVVSFPSMVAASTEYSSLADLAKKFSLSAETLDHLLRDLIAHRGSAMVYAGSRLPESVHVVVNAINEALGNSSLYSTGESTHSVLPLSARSDFDQLIERMKSGKVGIVLHLGANPVYDLPTSSGYRDALRSVDLVITMSECANETSELSHYLLPMHHTFESWGDHQVRSGVVSLQQPIIAPIFASRQKETALLIWMNGMVPYPETVFHTYLKTRWEKVVFPTIGASVDFQTFWNAALHDGVVTMKSPDVARQKMRTDAFATIAPASIANGMTLLITQSHTLLDGRLAGNGWLQEIPNPMTKVVWDNYASISPSTAKTLGVADNDVIECSTGTTTLRLPVYVQAGMADNIIAVDAGYGRTVAGPVGSNIGVRVNDLMQQRESGSACIVPLAKVSKTSESYPLVTTQEHHSLDDAFVKDMHLSRNIVREASLASFNANPKMFKGHQESHHLSLNKEIEYKGVKWAMAIDLNKCVGCAGCVTACISENNIPVVGKEQVQKGREMHWLRIDRYYSGTPDEPLAAVQPMLCQHCDNAPCENVCPVAATNHSPDGLNQMAYNRCVGTRYCSNNCPFKVRRFNFYNFRDHFADEFYEDSLVDMVHNPEVTVRSRGVMEKCTFCIQRIMDARQHAIEDGRELNGADVRTACQEACPAHAITFGDMNDATSDVARAREHDAAFHVLEELNVRPNVTYIAKLRNTHSEEAA